MIFGVCQGLADYFDVSVFWLRVLTVIAFLFLAGFPVLIAYIVGALLMKPAPIVPFESPADRDFYDTCASSRTMAVDRLKRTFDRLERRVRRMESMVTSREYRWKEENM